MVLHFYFRKFWIYFLVSIPKIVPFFNWTLGKLLFLSILPCRHLVVCPHSQDLTKQHLDYFFFAIVWPRIHKQRNGFCNPKKFTKWFRLFQSISMVNPHHSLIIRDFASRPLNGIGTYKSMKNTRNIWKLDEKCVLTRGGVETLVFRQ